MDQPTKKHYFQTQPFLGIELNMIETSKLHTVVNTIFDYQALANIDLSHQTKSLSQLSEQILSAYPQLKERTSKIRNCIMNNFALLHSIIDNIKKPLEYQNSNYHYSRFQLCRLLHTIARQWSSQGTQNRIYIQTIKQLLRKYNTTKDILVTGEILGRLIFELGSQYNINANESQFDHFLVTNYFLNICDQKHTIYPFVHNFLNHVSDEQAFKSFDVPDIQIEGIKHQIAISLGDFNWIYRHQTNLWEFVILNFAQKNGDFIKIFQRAYQCLQSKGKMLILTSLNYQNSNVQLSYDEIINIGIQMGMKLLHEGEEKQESQDQGSLVRSQSSIFYLVFEKL